MFIEESTVNTVSRTKKPVYADIKLKNLREHDNKLVLGSTSRSRHLSYYDVINVTPTLVTEAELYTLVFENNQGIQRTLVCDSKQLFITTRGYVNPSNFKTTDVFRDEYGYVNKIVSATMEPVADLKMYSIELKYGVSSYVNGILVK
jgi:hypothetical protein